MDFTPGIFDILIERGTDGRGADEPASGRRSQSSCAVRRALLAASDGADLPENYERQPAFQFIRDVAVDWDTTRVVAGTIGDYVIVARRNGKVRAGTWAPLPTRKRRTFDVPLSFLTWGRNTSPRSTRTGPGAELAHEPAAVTIPSVGDGHVRLHHRGARSRGGQAIRIRPAR